MGNARKLTNCICKLVFLTVFVFLVNKIPANAATFVFQETTYDTQNSEERYDKNGIHFYRFETDEGDPLIYMSGKNTSDTFDYCSDIYDLFGDIYDVSLYFDCQLKGHVKGYADESEYDLYVENIVFGNSFDTKNVTNMFNMFNGMTEITELDLSKFNTENVTNMSKMFSECNSIEALDLSSFATGKVTDMSDMFMQCNELETVDLSSFDTGKVTNMKNMFSDCYELNSIDISNFTIGENTNIACFLDNCDISKITLAHDHLKLKYSFLNICEDITIVGDCDCPKIKNNQYLKTESNENGKAEYYYCGKYCYQKLKDYYEATTDLVIDSGKCSENVTWEVTLNSANECVLTFKGKGIIPGWTYDETWGSEIVPEYYIYSRVKHVVIESGITGIGFWAFRNFNKMVSIVIPDGVKDIGESAFRSCYSLDSISIPDSVESLGECVFVGTSDSLKIVVPHRFVGDLVDSYGSNVTFEFTGTCDCKKVKNNKYLKTAKTESSPAVFYYEGEICHGKLEETYETDGYVEIASGSCSETVKWNVSYNLQGERVLIISGTGPMPDMVEVFNDISLSYEYTSPAYSEYRYQIERIIVENGITSIGNRAFANFPYAVSVDIPQSVTALADYSFAESNALKEINFSTGLKSIGSYAFYACDKLKELSVPQGVESIGNLAFSNSYGFTKISIPDSLQTLGTGIVSSCMNLSTLVLPHKFIDVYLGYTCNPTVEYTGLCDCKKLKSNNFLKTAANEESPAIYYYEGAKCHQRLEETYKYIDPASVKSFTFKGVEYLLEEASKTATLDGLNYYKFDSENQPSIIYINGESTGDYFNYSEFILTIFPETEDVYIVLDCVLKGSISGYCYSEDYSFEDSRYSILAIEFGDCFSTSKVTSMSGLFAGRHDYGYWDSDEEMTYKYWGCAGLTELDLSKLDTSNVTDMSFMFDDCCQLKSIDVTNFDTSNVTDMSHMFEACYKLEELDVSDFDTSKVTNMAGMFWACQSLESLNLGNFDTWYVTNMGWMFCGCTKLSELNLSNFCAPDVTSMGNMFWGCGSLTKLDISNFDIPSASSGFLSDCNNLTDLELRNVRVASSIALPYTMYDVEGKTSYSSLAPKEYDCSLVKTCPHSSKMQNISEDYLINEASCTEAATYYYQCEICGTKLTESFTVGEIPGHNVVTDDAVEATCTETGLSAGSHCSVCQKVLEEQKTVPALSHTEVIDEEEPASTTSTGKTEGKHCSVCDLVLVAQKVIPMLAEDDPYVIDDSFDDPNQICDRLVFHDNHWFIDYSCSPIEQHCISVSKAKEFLKDKLIISLEQEPLTKEDLSVLAYAEEHSKVDSYFLEFALSDDFTLNTTKSVYVTCDVACTNGAKLIINRVEDNKDRGSWVNVSCSNGDTNVEFNGDIARLVFSKASKDSVFTLNGKADVVDIYADEGQYYGVYQGTFKTTGRVNGKVYGNKTLKSDVFGDIDFSFALATFDNVTGTILDKGKLVCECQEDTRKLEESDFSYWYSVRCDNGEISEWRAQLQYKWDSSIYPTDLVLWNKEGTGLVSEFSIDMVPKGCDLIVSDTSGFPNGKLVLNQDFRAINIDQGELVLNGDVEQIYAGSRNDYAKGFGEIDLTINGDVTDCIEIFGRCNKMTIRVGENGSVAKGYREPIRGDKRAFKMVKGNTTIIDKGTLKVCSYGSDDKVAVLVPSDQEVAESSNESNATMNLQDMIDQLSDSEEELIEETLLDGGDATDVEIVAVIDMKPETFKLDSDGKIKEDSFTSLSEIDKAVSFTYEIPEELFEGGDIEIVNLHQNGDGSKNVSVVETTENGNQLSFETKQFSKFVVAKTSGCKHANVATDSEVEATCTEDGLTEGKHCLVCKEVLLEQKKVAAKGHTKVKTQTQAFLKSAASCAAPASYYYECSTCHKKLEETYSVGTALEHEIDETVTPATVKKNGSVVKKCKLCGEVIEETVIGKAFVIVEETAKYTGKAIKQTVKVTDANGKAIPKSFYSVSYKNNVKVGKATVTITFSGNYKGSVIKNFTIVKKEVIPAKVSGLKLTAGKKAFTVSWKEGTANADGYEIQYSTNKNFLTGVKTVKITSKDTVTKTISKLKAKTSYYVRVRSYNKEGKTTAYSAWNTVKKAVKTK